jgi:hypothetical protein
MPKSSGGKGEPWLAKQVDIARRNLAEWPEWMRQTARIEASSSGSGSSHTATKGTHEQKSKKPK